MSDDNNEHPLMNGASPEFYKGDNDTGFVLIHGFTGCPQEMKWLGRSLADKGYTVNIPRLPGHGTSPYDMIKYTSNDWLKEARAAYKKVNNEVKNTVVIGLSMGGAIIIILAAEFGIKKIVPISAPFRMMRTIFAYPFLPFIKVVKVPKSRVNSVEDASVRDSRCNYNGFLPISSVPHLNKLIKRARLAAPSLQGDVLLIHGRKDATISFNQVYKWQKVMNNADVSIIIMENSNHCVTIDYDKENTLNAILDFINK